jgi:hypothetical protein
VGFDFALEGLPLRLGAVADLFFFLPAMGENILSHANIPVSGRRFSRQKPMRKFDSINSYWFSTIQ